jgi:general secretion pathway protein J
MAMMAMILGSLATITSRWLPNWNRGIVRLQNNEHLALGLERITADIAAAEFVSLGHKSANPFFEGTPRAVTFVRRTLGPNARTGLEFIRIAEVNGERGPTTVRTSAPFAPAVEGEITERLPNFSNPVLLLRAPYTVAFTYAGADRSWRDDWRQQIQLPKAVRLIVRDAATGQTLSISTTASVHAELPVDCIEAKSFAECFTAGLRPAHADGNKPRS